MVCILNCGFGKKSAVQNSPQEKKNVGYDAWFCRLEVIKKLWLWFRFKVWRGPLITQEADIDDDDDDESMDNENTEGDDQVLPVKF